MKSSPTKPARRSRSTSAAKVRLQDLLSMAESAGMKSTELTAAFLAMRKDFNLPAREWSYLSGYCDARRDGFYRDKLVFRYRMNDGRLVEFNPAMPEADKAQITCPNAIGGHYWKGNLRPWFVSADEN